MLDNWLHGTDIAQELEFCFGLDKSKESHQWLKAIHANLAQGTCAQIAKDEAAIETKFNPIFWDFLGSVFGFRTSKKFWSFC